MNFILLIKKEELEAEDDPFMQDIIIFFSRNRVIVLLKTDGLYTSINIEILFLPTVFNSCIKFLKKKADFLNTDITIAMGAWQVPTKRIDRTVVSIENHSCYDT